MLPQQIDYYGTIYKYEGYTGAEHGYINAAGDRIYTDDTGILYDPQPILPKEITKDKTTGVQLASFRYYDGIAYAETNNLKQTGNWNDLADFKHFVVCCGEVAIQVDDTHFPGFKRTEI